MNSLKSELFWNERHFFVKDIPHVVAHENDMRMDSQKNIPIITMHTICTEGVNFWGINYIVEEKSMF